ncbi:hypothetical protein MMC13_006406 [Lambiella insularis]|nr:hypothetical protein [Lambiella insularis]
MNMLQLRSFARKLIHAICVDDALPVSCISQEIVDRLVVPTNLEEISQTIDVTDSSNETSIHEDIIWIEASLRNPKGVIHNDKTGDAALTIQTWAARAIIPSSIFAIRSHFDPSSPPQATAWKIVSYRLMAIAGLRLLARVQYLVPALHDNLSLDLLTCLASYTDERDPWTESEAARAAKALLEQLIDASIAGKLTFTSTLISGLLQGRVKPLFLRSKNIAITAQGRKANYPVPIATNPSDSEVELKQWKFRDIYIVTVFGWILSVLDVRILITYANGTNTVQESTLEEHWPLVIPPLLAILDDEAISNKVKGCELLERFLTITPASLLHRTGLGEVFQDTLLPCLSYLPSLTPEDESLSLLGAVYPALLSLIRARYPDPASVAKKMTTLDKILRVGILKGFAYAGEHVRIATILMCKTTDLISEMGIMSVRRLKDILPLITGVLSAPFSPAHPPLLLAAALALQCLILNAWPRMSYYRGEVLKGLTLSWCMLNEDHRRSDELSRVRDVLRQNAALLREVLGKDSETMQEVYQLLHAVPQLDKLLPS